MVGGVVIGLTANIAHHSAATSLLRTQYNRIISAEVAFFGILAVETISSVVLQRFKQVGSQQIGIAARAVIRVIAYLILLVSVVSILASNPVLAVSVGGVTGVVIAFSAQNLVGNAFAGVFLAIARPFRVGETITVSGVTGTVVDVRVMHVVIDTEKATVLVPTSAVFGQAIQRLKPIQEDEDDRERRE